VALPEAKEGEEAASLIAFSTPQLAVWDWDIYFFQRSMSTSPRRKDGEVNGAMERKCYQHFESNRYVFLPS
jgi:hypothetical protein